MTDIRAAGFKSKRKLDEYLSELDDGQPIQAVQISVNGDRMETVRHDLAQLQTDIEALRQQYTTRSKSYALRRKTYLLSVAAFAGLACLVGRRISKDRANEGNDCRRRGIDCARIGADYS